MGWTTSDIVTLVSLVLLSVVLIVVLLKYRDTVCHYGILKAHAILVDVSPSEVCALFQSVGCSASAEELQWYFTLPALRAI